VSLGDDLAAALPELQAEAESRMHDSIVFTSPGAAPTWDDATGTYSSPTGAEVYNGKCRIRQAAPAPQNADAGETSWAVDRLVVSLPLDGSGGVVDGCTGVVTAATDPEMVGLTITALAGHFQSDSTARRIPCQVVSHDV
jgi:hypothetical protein